MTEAERELLLAIAGAVGHSYKHIKELAAAVRDEAEPDAEEEAELEGEEDDGNPKKKAKKR